MPAGRLDRRLQLQRASVTRNALNELVKAWVPIGPATGVRCQRTPVSDGERVRAQQLGATITDRFTIRWAAAWADLGPEDRLVFEGRAYGVLAVKELGRRRGLEITAAATAERVP